MATKKTPKKPAADKPLAKPAAAPKKPAAKAAPRASAPSAPVAPPPRPAPTPQPQGPTAQMCPLVLDGEISAASFSPNKCLSCDEFDCRFSEEAAQGSGALRSRLFLGEEDGDNGFGGDDDGWDCDPDFPGDGDDEQDDGGDGDDEDF